MLEILKDQRDFTGRVTSPVTDSEFAPYLAETRFITPSIPEVGDLAHAICGEETDGWLVTQKILSWVYGNMQVDMTRAAGLPTKVALGERYQDGVWVGHLWNEVWLGEWISVDPSHGQPAPDALFLKFVDSSDVMGTQKVRMGLTGRLGISIEEVTIDGEEVGIDLETGVHGQAYTNADYRCHLTVPDDYQLIETEEQAMPMLVARKTADPETQAVLIPFPTSGRFRPTRLSSSELRGDIAL